MHVLVECLPYSTQGGDCALSPEDLRAATVGARELFRNAYELRVETLDEMLTDCPAGLCHETILHQLADELRGIAQSANPSPLEPLYYNFKESGFCDECLDTVEAMDIRRLATWGELPEVFQLPPWGELRNEF